MIATAKSMSIGAGWIVRRNKSLVTLWIMAVTVLTLADRWWWSLALFGVVVIPGLAGSYAGRRWPAQWWRWVREPRMRRQWKRRARRQWDRISDSCGLSQKESRKRLRRRSGHWKRVVITTVHRPRLKRPRAHGNTLELTIRHRRGQRNEDVLKAVEEIVSALGAVEWATAQPNLQTVVIQAVMRDSLRKTVYAKMPTKASAKVGVVDLGRRQDGERWTISLRGQHTLIVGVTGSGKGSVIGGALAQLAPSVAGGTVQIWGVDLKGGVEFGPFAGIFTSIAYTALDAVVLLNHLKEIKGERERRMRATHTRLHTPTPGSPLIVLAIDELAAFAYDGTPKGKRLAAEFGGLLGLFLTQGRALGISVIAAQQDPRKDVLALRERFTQTVCLRTATIEETTMVLGRGHNIPAHLIDERKPGTAYVVGEDRATSKVRADYWPDGLLVRIGATFRPPVDVSGALVLPDAGPRRRGPDRRPRAASRPARATAGDTPGPGAGHIVDSTNRFGNARVSGDRFGGSNGGPAPAPAGTSGDTLAGG